MKISFFVYIFSLFIALTSFGCDSSSKPKEKEKNYLSEYEIRSKRFTGIQRGYYDDNAKKIKRKISYKDGRRHGKCLFYYENGTVKKEINYRYGSKHGFYGWFFESGKPYLTVNYKNDRYDGEFTRYHYSGKPSFVAKYKNGFPCLGAKEYDKQGKEVPQPKIILTDKGYDKNAEVYTFHLKLSEEAKELKFFDGILNDSSCFDNRLIEYRIKVRDGVGIVELPLKPDYYIKTPVTFIALAKVKYDVETVYKLDYKMFAKGY